MQVQTAVQITVDGTELMANAGTTTRFLLIVCTVLLVIGVLAKVSWVFLRIARGQKFLLVGLLGFMVYTADALRAGFQAGLPFSPRLIAAIVGVAAMSCWMVEPLKLFAQRWGSSPFTLPSEDEGDDRD